MACHAAPDDFMTGSTARRRVSPRLPCPKCRKLCPIEARICTCGHWLISPPIVEGSLSLSPEVDVVETREASSSLSSPVTREEMLSFRDPTLPIERDLNFTIQMPGVLEQMDEVLFDLPRSEPGELSEVDSSVIPTAGESESLISNRVSAEPSESGEMLSNSIIAAPTEHGRLLLSPSSTTSKELEDTSTIVGSATPNEKDEGSAGLNPTETRAVDVTESAELEKEFTRFDPPVQGEIDESMATASSGYIVAWESNARSIARGIGRIEKYLAIVAVLVFVSSLLFAYLIQPFENVSGDPEVIAQDSVDSRLGPNLQTTVVEGDPSTKQSEGIESQNAVQPSGDGSLNGGVRGSTSQNSLPNGPDSNPSQLPAMTTTEPEQPGPEKPSPRRKREKVDKKNVTVDDLITDKKKITVDDLINDN